MHIQLRKPASFIATTQFAKLLSRGLWIALRFVGSYLWYQPICCGIPYLESNTLTTYTTEQYVIKAFSNDPLTSRCDLRAKVETQISTESAYDVCIYLGYQYDWLFVWSVVQPYKNTPCQESLLKVCWVYVDLHIEFLFSLSFTLFPTQMHFEYHLYNTLGALHCLFFIFLTIKINKNIEYLPLNISPLSE